MSATMKLFTAQEAAEAIGKTDGRIRQICREYEDATQPIGRKLGRDWFLTEEDIERIRNFPARGKDSSDQS